ncbi:hypothetical protein A4X06_0g1836 [Tilletia controversa]|uniref:Carboxylesterase type B domain-containing protein n=1 Tax=Tilletia controversa TaxID=13291 RepID=A0A8X7MXH7_9BASI|nr:hypothetical protein A4X06_0g1836 [Tilletia controversa]
MLIASVVGVPASHDHLKRSCGGTSSLPDPRIDIKQGPIVGYTGCVDDVPISYFLGIPYAQPPTGSRRFAKPKPISEKKPVIDAKAFGHICWQIPSSTYPRERMDENCLTINIMAPADAQHRDKKLPVMVWHHGGGFTTGASTYHNGSRLVAESVKLEAPAIWVNFNYRINAFGFLSSRQVLKAAQAGEAALNVGLYDAREALRWVQQNIDRFGGDPQRSAGAYAVGAQLLANGGDSEGLFQSAIMHSGSPAGGTALTPAHPRLQATFANLTAMVNCPNDETSVQCLRQIDQVILANASAIIAQNYSSNPYLGYWPWTPVQDAAVDGFWFREQPSKLVNKGQYAVVPMITGDCADEGTIFAAHDLENATSFDQWFRHIAVADVSTDPDQQSRVTGLLQRLYELVPDDVTQGSPYFNPPNAVSKGVTNVSDPIFQPATNQYKRAARMFSTWRYEAPRRKFLRLFANQTKSGAWTYRFHQHDNSNAIVGTSHGSEIVYILGNTSTINSTGLYPPLSKLMQRAWISFANFNDPTALGHLDWPRYSEEERSMIQFKGLNVTLIRDDYQEGALAYMRSDEMSAILSS